MVAGHRGKIVKSMGDGWIVKFSSAVDAVTCAMRVQDQMVAEEKVRLRIGVHLGDVIIEQEDIFGDGVNIAARLEALSEPGGVTISDAVYGVLDGTLRPAFDDAGEHSLKNIKRPVRVWTRGGVTGAVVDIRNRGMEGFPCLDIRPVSTTSPLDDVRELADALTHDLAAYLGATRWLRTRLVNAERPGRFVLSGTLRTSGTRLRLETRLTAPDNAVLWQGKHDGGIEEAFDWQDNVATSLATHSFGRIADHVVAQIRAKPEAELNWEALTILASYASRADHEAFADGLRLIEVALQQKPRNSYPYEVALSFWAGAASIGFGDIADQYAAKTDEWFSKANEFGGLASSSRAVLAFFEFVKHGDAARARADVEAFLRDIPFDLDALAFGGFLFNYIGEPQTALACFRKFDMFATHHQYATPVRSGTGGALMMLGRLDEAIGHFDTAIRQSPDYPAPYRWKAAALAHLGRMEEARAILAKHDAMLPGVTLRSLAAHSYSEAVTAHKIYIEGLRLAGMPEG